MRSTETNPTQFPNRETGPAPEGNGVDTAAADQTAWCEAAAARKYRVHEGRVYSYGSGMIFELPAIVGFSHILPSVRPLVFQAVAQFATNRIGQTQDGDVNAKVGAVLLNGQGMPGAQSNDAFDSCYVDHIASLVEAQLGKHTHKDGVELKGDALKAAKDARDKIIEASAAKEANRTKHFAASVKAASERAKNVVASGKKRVAKTADTTAAMDL